MYQFVKDHHRLWGGGQADNQLRILEKHKNHLSKRVLLPRGLVDGQPLVSGLGDKEIQMQGIQPILNPLNFVLEKF